MRLGLVIMLGETRAKTIGAARQVVSRGLERYLGLRTRGTIWQREHGYEYGLYRPSSWLVLSTLFGQLEVAEDDVFADIGSGMGRGLFVAAHRPFKRVIGIERSGELTEIARQNIRRTRHRLRCAEIELETIDVLDWDIPADLTVVYLACPFPEPVLERFMARLRVSIDRHPRTVRLIYYFATDRDKEVISRVGRVGRVSFRVPRYLRSAFAEVSMFRLRP